MKKIKIKFFGVGYNEYDQASIKIFKNNKLIYDGYTYNGSISLKLKTNHIYKIKVSFLNQNICKYFYVSNNSKIYYFYFNNIIIKQNNNIVTFLLTDYFYKMPIERGELIVWPKT